MKKIFEFLEKRSAREWGLFFFVVSAAVLATVFISEKFGFHPCQLCIWQRWPFAVTGVLSLLVIAAARYKYLATLLLVLIGLTFAVGASIAFFHLGVEYKWWTFASDCSTSIHQGGGSVEDFLERLKKAPTVKCDDRFPFLFGMTMAFYNALMSSGLTVLSFLSARYVLRYSARSSSLSQYK